MSSVRGIAFCLVFAWGLSACALLTTSGRAKSAAAVIPSDLVCLPDNNCGWRAGETARLINKCARGKNEFEIKRNRKQIESDHTRLMNSVFYADVEWTLGEYDEQLRAFPVPQRAWESFLLKEPDGSPYLSLVFNKVIEYPYESARFDPDKAEKYLAARPDRKIKGRVYFRFLTLRNNATSEMAGGAPVLKGSCDYDVNVLGVRYYTPDWGEVLKRF